MKSDKDLERVHVGKRADFLFLLMLLAVDQQNSANRKVYLLGSTCVFRYKQNTNLLKPSKVPQGTFKA